MTCRPPPAEIEAAVDLVQYLKIVIPLGAIERALLQAAALEASAGAARAKVIAAEFLDQLDVTVDDALAAFHSSLRGETTSGVWPWAQKQGTSNLSRFLVMITSCVEARLAAARSVNSRWSEVMQGEVE